VLFARFQPFWRKTGALALRQQVFFAHQQVAERRQQMQPVVVLGEAAIADFAVTKDLFDVPEGMLHFGTNTGFDFLGFQFVGIQLLPGAGAPGDESGHILTVLMFVPLLNAKVTGVTKDSLLFTMQQFTGGHDVVNVGSGGIDTVNQAQRVVDADVHLHAEVPLVTFLGLVHFGITRLCSIFGRRWGGNDRSVHDGAFAHQHALLAQVTIDFLEDHLRQGSLFQQVPEFQQCGRVWHGLYRQINADKVAKGLTVINSVFKRLVCQGVPLLDKVHAQHAVQGCRRTAAFTSGVGSRESG